MLNMKSNLMEIKVKGETIEDRKIINRFKEMFSSLANESGLEIDILDNGYKAV